MRKILFWVTVVSGATAAYLMYKRGVPLGKAAQESWAHPLGALAGELKTSLPS